MTLREAWDKSGMSCVYRADMPAFRMYKYLDKVGVWEAMDDQWLAEPPPEPEKLPLSQALKKWRRTRRAAWVCHQSSLGLDTERRLSHLCISLSLDDLEANDWVEARL